jgi:hypothetical protein
MKSSGIRNTAVAASAAMLLASVASAAEVAAIQLATQSQPSPAAAESAYRGWKSLELRNDLIALHVVPEIGGRVMQFQLGGKEFFWVNPSLAGKHPPPSGLAPDGGWLNYGGDKLWPAPQGWDNDTQWPGPPDAVLDGQPYRVERLDHGTAIRLTSRDDPRSGIRFSRIIRIAGDSTRVSFEATMTNVDGQSRRWGIWAHTQLAGGQAGGASHNSLLNAWCPLNPQSRFAKGYRVIFGTEDNPSFQPDPARGLMRVNYQYQVGKIGLDSPAGWVATVDGASGAVFVQRFQFEHGKEYPDESSVEFWLNGVGKIRAYNKDLVLPANAVENPYVFESEVLSPFARLAPGESYTWHYDWLAANIGGDFPVVDCSEAGITCEPLRTVVAEGKLHLAGRFGVFAPGSARLIFLDARGVSIRDWDLPNRVSPLAPLVLQVAAQAPPNATAVELVLLGAHGQAVGRLAKTDLN